MSAVFMAARRQDDDRRDPAGARPTCHASRPLSPLRSPLAPAEAVPLAPVSGSGDQVCPAKRVPVATIFGAELLTLDAGQPDVTRIDKSPVGTARMEFSFGLAQHTQGAVWFARLETLPAESHPLGDLPAPKLARRAPPSGQGKDRHSSTIPSAVEGTQMIGGMRLAFYGG